MVESYIKPSQPIGIIGASSDHMIIDATRKNGLKVGDIIEFSVNAGLLGARKCSRGVEDSEVVS